MTLNDTTTAIHALPLRSLSFLSYLARWCVWLAVSWRSSAPLRSTEQCQWSNGKYHTSETHAAVHVSTVTSAVTWPEELTEACAVLTSSSNRPRSASLYHVHSTGETPVTQYDTWLNVHGDSEKNAPTRKSQYLRNASKNFAPNFAHLFRTKLHLSVLLCAVFTSLTLRWRQRNFNNVFRNRTRSWFNYSNPNSDYSLCWDVIVT